MDTNLVLLGFFALCCSGCFFLPLIFGIVGLTVSKNPDAKQRALILIIISAIAIVLETILGINALRNSLAHWHE